MQLSLGCVLGYHPFVEAILVLDMPYVCVKGAKVIPQLSADHNGTLWLCVPFYSSCPLLFDMFILASLAITSVVCG